MERLHEAGYGERAQSFHAARCPYSLNLLLFTNLETLQMQPFCVFSGGFLMQSQ